MASRPALDSLRDGGEGSAPNRETARRRSLCSADVGFFRLSSVPCGSCGPDASEIFLFWPEGALKAPLGETARDPVLVDSDQRPKRRPTTTTSQPHWSGWVDLAMLLRLYGASKGRRSWDSGQELLYSHSCCSRLTSASCQPTPPTDAVLVAIKHRRVHAWSTAGARALACGMNALPGLAPVHPAAMGSSGVPGNEPVSKRIRIGSSPFTESEFTRTLPHRFFYRSRAPAAAPGRPGRNRPARHALNSAGPRSLRMGGRAARRPVAPRLDGPSLLSSSATPLEYRRRASLYARNLCSTLSW